MLNHTFAILVHYDSPYLNECLLSLKNQSEKSEIFISTSAPSDYLFNIAKKYKIKIDVNKDYDGTSSCNWNFAYKTAETKYVTLAHHDDIYLSNYTETLMAKLEKCNGLIGFTNYSELKNNKRIHNNFLLIFKRLLLIPFFLRNIIFSKFLKKTALAFGSSICCPSVMFNKEVIGNCNVFKSNYAGGSEDWEAWLNLADRNGAFVYSSKILLLHRIHEISGTTVQLESKSKQKTDLIMFQKIWGRYIGYLIAKLYSLSYLSNK